MESRYQEIQSRYLADMRAIMPVIMAWWRKRAVRDPAELEGSLPQNDFETRWPAGPTAHPRVLLVFRTYFLEVEALNLENEMKGHEGNGPAHESDWGRDADEQESDLELPIDILVDDLPDLAPDVYQLVRGMVFVPIGLSPDEEYC